MAIKYTEEQLNNVDKSFLVQMFLNQQEEMAKATNQVELLTNEVQSLNKKMQTLMEQLVLSKKARFGQSSEKMEDAAQISFMEVNGTIVFFNEAEAVCDLSADEPEDLEPKLRGKKTSGKKDADMSGLPVNRINHYMTENELIAEFGENGWKQLPDAISKRYKFIPAKVIVTEHHVGVYASKKDGHMVKAEHPRGLLKGSPVSPSIAAAIMNGKYVNAVPLYRLEKEFERYGLAITRQNMANWMIRLGESYISVMYDYLHELIYDYHVIQADETPVLVNKDGRKAGSKSYMWVYRSGYMNPEKQIILYEYQLTRNASHPREFLKEFKGICVTDGYQVYHTLEKEKEDLTIAGCWVHMRRRFEQAWEVIPKPARKGTISYMAMKQIQAIYREEGKLKELHSKERLEQRQAIRGFCAGKKNWQMIDTINGAKTSAMIYSIAETAKANNLKPYDYFEHLLEEIPKHMEDTDRSFLKELLPWSDKLPKHIRK